MLQQNTYKIKVNAPCHEDWQGMTDTNAGKYCNSCKKEVIDFTNFSNTQITNYFLQNGLKSGCGKFLNTQIEQIRITIDEDLIVHKLSYWNKFMIAMLICFGGTCLNATVTFGQIIKTDTSIAKQQCDTFNTGESYKQAAESILESTKDSMIPDTTIQMVDTSAYERDTLKLLPFHLDSSLTKLDLRSISIHIGATYGFFVPILTKNVVVKELFPNEVIISDKSILGEKQEAVSEYNNAQHIAINKNNFIEKEVPSSPPKNTEIVFEAILPQEEKKKKKK